MLEHIQHSEIDRGSEAYPSLLAEGVDPPAVLYVIGDPAALAPGLAVVGARRATPYGLGCTEVFAGRAAQLGITVISGGAIGCDQMAACAALGAGGVTVAVMGGGADVAYPASAEPLFERIVGQGGAIVSEQEWGSRPLRWMFVRRNRIISGLATATLVIEAGLPSGTFETSNTALDAGRDVLVVPGSIHSPQSRGSNRLLLQGAWPVVDLEAFDDKMAEVFGAFRLSSPDVPREAEGLAGVAAGGLLPDGTQSTPLIRRLALAVAANPMRADDIAEALGLEPSAAVRLIAESESFGVVERYRDGRYGAPVPRSHRHARIG